MRKRDFTSIVEEIVEKDSRYLKESYYFVREGLEHTLKTIGKQKHQKIEQLSGKQILEGLKDYALKEFGPMSKLVLNEWGVKSCKDFGQMIKNMDLYGLLGKTEMADLKDFQKGYSFTTAFVKPFLPTRSTVAKKGKGRKDNQSSSKRKKKVDDSGKTHNHSKE
ncbi:hypothetical protein A946_05720 [Methylacidiphilum kamchatkense Kam1]|uniref:Putative repeat protein (TIGR04138 family) n=1 Tax=Methylacidiphilum kamchatkense Kam1 TaxID=1202785 RepID=A0A0C1V5A1_9BACT|nr:Minf_1886 family protein [Methylacidiphilum kamchatkense]KIE58900.1 hypothetical protein A946_05720 [Methylacidiphilum kamchatkense Kam1]QDQ41671.1 putative repeat protein (TIGR04138 family) [Methylacidiphilum kamchatkense Kam1]